MIKTLRGEGVPVIGYTWFPLFTMIDWRYRFAQEPLEDFYLELGFYRLNRTGKGKRWLDTPLVPKIKRFIENSRASGGRSKDLQDRPLGYLRRPVAWVNDIDIRLKTEFFGIFAPDIIPEIFQSGIFYQIYGTSAEASPRHSGAVNTLNRPGYLDQSVQLGTADLVIIPQ